MINQVVFEGYVVRAWQYQGDRYLRLANHRPRVEESVECSHSGVIQSDYITARLSPEVRLEIGRVSQGDRVLVTGKVWGRDILEPLGKVIRKSGLEIDLPDVLSKVIVSRPTAQILADEANLLDGADAPALKSKKRKPRRPRRPAENEAKTMPLENGKGGDAEAKEEDAAIVTGKVELGVDLATLVEEDAVEI